jgi:Tol biopolymer transport system component/serine/threonine protein kinase
MGEVYQARDSRLNRQVALKVLPPDRVANPERRQRLVQEAQLASSLQHPNIVVIYDIGSSDGVDYIAMELVRGRTLESLIPRAGMRLGEVLKLAVQVADALTAAHAAGVVHRDLKPGNIMVTDAGMVKVLDFGLAKLTETAPVDEMGETRTQVASVQTEHGTILGSAAYMSPEQAEARQVDARSDIFSFGAILYEMLTGQRAFAGESKMSTLAAVLRAEPKPLSELTPGLPREVERLVMRCLRKDVNRRAQHMADLKLALEELREDSESGSLEAATPARLPARQRGGWIAMAAAAILAATGAAWWMHTPKQETLYEPTPLTTYAGSESFPSFSPDGTQVAFMWNGERQQQYDIYIKLVGGGPALRLTTDEGYHGAPAWSPDGRWIAYVGAHTGGRRGVFVIPALGGPERLLLDSTAALYPAWSPDGKWLALSPPAGLTGLVSGITLLSFESGDRRNLEQLSPALLGSRSGAFSPDGRRLAYVTLSAGTYSSTIWTVALTADMKPQGQPTQVTRSKLGAAYPAWTPDGREIVFQESVPESSGSISRVPADGSGAIRKIPGIGYTSGPMALSRTGRLAFERGGIDSDIWHYDLQQKSAPQKWASSTAFDASGEYSPDGKRIAFSSNRSGAREIWLCDADGSNAVQLTHFGGPVAGTPRWSPDGRLITFEGRPDGDANLFVVSSEGGAVRRLTTYNGEDARPDWSHDGNSVYFSSNRGGKSQLWRVPAAGGAPVQVAKQDVYTMRVSPDGEWIFYCAEQLSSSIRRMRPDGSSDAPVVPDPVIPLTMTIVRGGIYAVVRPDPSRPYWSVQHYTFDGHKISETLKLDFAPGVLGLSLTPDERYLLLTHPDDKGTDLMLVEGFR